MKAFFAALGGFFATTIGYILLVGLILGVAWLITCSLVYLVTLLFGWTFNWAIATGIWILLIILRWIFGGKC